MFNDLILKYVESKSQNCLAQILKRVPSTRHEEIKNLIFNLQEEINSVFTTKKIYLRDKDGKVSEFKSTYDAAKSIDYRVTTLDNYLQRGKGYFEFAGYIISIIPIEEKVIERGFWFRDLKGKVQKLNSLESLARVSGLSIRSLEVYLSKNNSFTKRGYVSKTPLEELSFEDAYSLNFFRQHKRWPTPNEIPNDTGPRRY